MFDWGNETGLIGGEMTIDGNTLVVLVGGKVGCTGVVVVAVVGKTDTSVETVVFNGSVTIGGTGVVAFGLGYCDGKESSRVRLPALLLRD